MCLCLSLFVHTLSFILWYFITLKKPKREQQRNENENEKKRNEIGNQYVKLSFPFCLNLQFNFVRCYYCTFCDRTFWFQCNFFLFIFFNFFFLLPIFIGERRFFFLSSASIFLLKFSYIIFNCVLLLCVCIDFAVYIVNMLAVMFAIFSHNFMAHHQCFFFPFTLSLRWSSALFFFFFCIHPTFGSFHCHSFDIIIYIIWCGVYAYANNVYFIAFIE